MSKKRKRNKHSIEVETRYKNNLKRQRAISRRRKIEEEAPSMAVRVYQGDSTKRWDNYEDYLRSTDWRKKKEEAIKRDGHRCRVCNGKTKLQVHHRTYARLYDEELSDLTTLCEKCHTIFHKYSLVKI